MNKSLAICLQVWEGDVYIAKRLIALICSIEPEARGDIEFILSARRGTNMHAVREISSMASKKFKSSHVIQCKRFGVDWPSGCNELWSETMMRVGQMKKDGRLKSTGVLTFEADCIPMRPDWLAVLRDEWAYHSVLGKLCVGHAHTFPSLTNTPSEPNHINGNAIFDCNLLDKHPEMHGSESTQGWDAYHGKLLLKIGADTPFIHQLYRIEKITRIQVEDIRKRDVIPALFHGVKKFTGLEAVESMVADGSFFTRLDGDKITPSQLLKMQL